MLAHPAPRRSKGRRPQGFTLVEIMVAMVIGMLAVIVMFQMFSNSEAQKRSTTGAGDAQASANIALVTLKSDIRGAGYGFIAPSTNANMSPVGCKLTGQIKLPGQPSAVTVALPILAPLLIINRENTSDPLLLSLVGDDNTDTLLVVAGNSAASQDGAGILSKGGTGYGVRSSVSVLKDEWVLPVLKPQNAGEACRADQPVVLQQVGPLVGEDVNRTFVPILGTTDTVLGTAALYDLGMSPHARAYRVKGEQLKSCDFFLADCSDESKWDTLASDVVSLRAEYRQADGSFSQEPPTSNYCGWSSILGVRLVLVVRNSQLEKTVVTTLPKDKAANPSAALAPVWSGSAAIDLSGNAKWQNYRYVALESAVPIRNQVWAGVRPSGCPEPTPPAAP